eukprot:3260585-Rhodomonas_salina.7
MEAAFREILVAACARSVPGIARQARSKTAVAVQRKVSTGMLHTAQQARRKIAEHTRLTLVENESTLALLVAPFGVSVPDSA